jgi:N-formylglutamate amidohydrolase
MSFTLDPDAALPFEVVEPKRRLIPLVFASPHSGRDYSREFINLSSLDALSLRRSEDSFVDEIFEGAQSCGAPLLRALFPRAFVDPNREPFELDPTMFEDDLPAFVNTSSPRVAAGLGTIARVVGNGTEIYSGKLRYAEALDRINACYKPYHAALRQLIDETHAQFGFCILVDCHSMPTLGCKASGITAAPIVDFVLGDCFGIACMPALTDVVERTLNGFGYRTRRNNPYAGGFTTRHYGRPRKGVHALQIEISRTLYMNEETIEPIPYLTVLKDQVTELITTLAAFASSNAMRR